MSSRRKESVQNIRSVINLPEFVPLLKANPRIRDEVENELFIKENIEDVQRILEEEEEEEHKQLIKELRNKQLIKELRNKLNEPPFTDAKLDKILKIEKEEDDRLKKNYEKNYEKSKSAKGNKSKKRKTRKRKPKRRKTRRGRK
jgi:hypothetical protein